MEAKRKNNHSIFALLFLSFFIFSWTNSPARELDIIPPEGIEKLTDEVDTDADDFYDLDYDPSEVGGDIIKVWDPWEKFNRKMHIFNMGLLRHVVYPVYYNVYAKVTTPGMRKSVSNVVRNFRMPIIFMNYALQLDFHNAAKTVYSFGMNTIIGVGGVFDVAGHNGVYVPSTDLGVTLAKYHVPAGPYLVLPFFGPNDFRGITTWVGELMVDPLNYNMLEIGGKRPLLDDWIIYTRATLYVLDSASFAIVNFYDLMEASFDSYVMMRDAYGQSQSYKINKARGK